MLGKRITQKLAVFKDRVLNCYLGK